MAMACFQTVFPCYLHVLPEDERAAGFENVFEVCFQRSPRRSVLRVNYGIAIADTCWLKCCNHIAFAEDAGSSGLGARSG